MRFVALGIVLLAGLYLVALGAFALGAPDRAGRFLRGFAASARTHYAELALRALVGGALVLQAPHMRFAAGFRLFGWMLLGTTVCLAAIPWRAHHAFAQRVVPLAIRYLALVGLVSILMGTLVLFAALVNGRD